MSNIPTGTSILVIALGLFCIAIAIFLIGYMTVDCFRFVKEREREEKEREKRSSEETPSEDLPTTADRLETMEIEDSHDEDEYESRIMDYLRELGISTYYANYTQASVEVTGKLFCDNCVEISPTQEVFNDNVLRASIVDWIAFNKNFGAQETRIQDTNSCYAFRLSYRGRNYLLWGKDRADAYLNLFSFAVLQDLYKNEPCSHNP